MKQEQDGKCTRCEDGCEACDARFLPVCAIHDVWGYLAEMTDHSMVGNEDLAVHGYQKHSGGIESAYWSYEAFEIARLGCAGAFGDV